LLFVNGMLPPRHPLLRSTSTFLLALLPLLASAGCGRIDESATDRDPNANGNGGPPGGGAQTDPAPAPHKGTPKPDLPLVCSESDVPASAVCMPGTLRSRVASKIAIEEATGCWSHCQGVTRTESCVVNVDAAASTVSLAIEVRSCSDGNDGPRNCTSMCGTLRVTCEVPPLDAGTYRLVSPATPGYPGLEESLVVSDDATTTECTSP